MGRLRDARRPPSLAAASCPCPEAGPNSLTLPLSTRRPTLPGWSLARSRAPSQTARAGLTRSVRKRQAHLPTRPRCLLAYLRTPPRTPLLRPSYPLTQAKLPPYPGQATPLLRPSYPLTQAKLPPYPGQADQHFAPRALLRHLGSRLKGHRARAPPGTTRRPPSGATAAPPLARPRPASLQCSGRACLTPERRTGCRGRAGASGGCRIARLRAASRYRFPS